MASEWRESTWGEEISLEYGKALRNYDTDSGKFRVYGSNGPIGWASESLAPGPGVILGRKGAYRGVRYSQAPFFVIDTAYYVVRKTELDMRWLYYAIKYHKLGEIDDGSPIPSTTRAAVYVRDLQVPPLAEQKAIAEVLGALDDKIELNRRMNATLEAMARALFQSWFVDFDPVRAKLDGRQPSGLDEATAALFPAHFQDSSIGHIPQGWKVAEIGEIANVIDCLHAKKPERCDTGRLYLQLNNIRDDGLIDIADTYFVSEADYQKWISRMEATEGDCVITNVGRVGAVAQIPEGVKATLGRNMTGIRCKAPFKFPTFLLECLLSGAMREEIRMKMDTGTILDALNVKNIPKLRFVLPPAQIMASYELIARPLRRKMEQNLSESRTLASLRDSLLPKLLSGELSVAQTKQIAPNLLQFPDYAPDRTARKTTDEFVEAVVIAQLVRKLATAQYPLGRKRYNKLAYLAHRKAEEDVTRHYLKKAAGPYSPWAKYGGPEKIALQNGYVKQAKSGAFEGLIVGDKIDKIDNYVSNYPVCAAIDWVIGKFRFKKNDDLELLATVDFAALDLLCNGKDVTTKTVKGVIANNKEWSPKLNRAVFSDENIDQALAELADLFPAIYAT